MPGQSTRRCRAEASTSPLGFERFRSGQLLRAKPARIQNGVTAKRAKMRPQAPSEFELVRYLTLDGLGLRRWAP
jgi:hypothetical protein